eukprot:scaffold1840_cov89-Cylindrotheca_fusiformis.AAC.1
MVFQVLEAPKLRDERVQRVIYAVKGAQSPQCQGRKSTKSHMPPKAAKPSIPGMKSTKSHMPSCQYSLAYLLVTFVVPVSGDSQPPYLSLHFARLLRQSSSSVSLHPRVARITLKTDFLW